MNTLNKCPLCGSKVKITEYPDYYMLYEIKCKCGLGLVKINKEELITGWEKLTKTRLK